MIQAPQGFEFLAFDFSQAESWVVAYKANEPNMKNSLKFSDIHTDTAVAIYDEAKSACKHKWIKGVTRTCEVCGADIPEDQRYIGKQTNHSSAYGVEPLRMVQLINKNSDKAPYITVTIGQTTHYSHAWHKRYNVQSWWAEVQEQLWRDRTLKTIYGGIRTFYGPMGKELFKAAYAHEPQSTVADHANGAVQPELGIEGGFLGVHEKFVKKGFCKIINQAHDSILIEAPKPISTDMISAIHALLYRPMVIKGEEFWIPVDCEKGEVYGELEKISIKH